MNQPTPYVREPIQPPPYVKYAHSLGRGMLTFYQVEQLVQAINPAYVEGKQGKAYLAQHQARAEMNRIFGYGNWDVIEEDPVLLYETSAPGSGSKSGSTYWVAGYRMRVTVNIRDLWGMHVATVSGTHAEENANLPNRGEAHAMAITSVSSYALRRALINLGDRFGLGLYNGGSKNPHGQYTVQLEAGQLFNWKALGEQPQQAAVAAPQQPSHATIVAEPAVPEGHSEGADEAGPSGNGFLQTPQQQRPPEAERFPNALAQVQAQNQVARNASVSPEMAARIQAGMKLDQQQESQREHYERENAYANDEARLNGGAQ
jgi:hypothetical protein